jgi:hypothetical protein
MQGHRDAKVPPLGLAVPYEEALICHAGCADAQRPIEIPPHRCHSLSIRAWPCGVFMSSTCAAVRNWRALRGQV